MELAEIFLNSTHNKKMDKLANIKMKNFCLSKDH